MGNGAWGTIRAAVATAVIGAIGVGGCNGTGADPAAPPPGMPSGGASGTDIADAAMPPADASGLACSSVGNPCPQGTECCAGGTCVVDPVSSTQFCAATCTADGQCRAGCCVAIKGSTVRACGPAEYCMGGAGGAAGGGTGGSGGSAGTGGTGGGGTGADTSTCLKPGTACTQQGSCCGGANAPCVSGVCAAACVRNSDCASACCLAVGSERFCAPNGLCPQPPPTSNPDAGAATCIAPGGVCTSASTCCETGFCFEGICAAPCKASGDCANGCCVLDLSAPLCGPVSLCSSSGGTGGIGGGGGVGGAGGGTAGIGGTGGNPSPTGNNGVVLAGTKDEWFGVETLWGNQLFQARTGYCPFVTPGDAVIFTASTAACVSNTFVDLRTSRSCEVWCSTTPNIGTVSAVADRTITVAVRYQAKAFELGFGCGSYRPGDTLMFTQSAAVCVSNTVLNLRLGTGCDVRCL
jgi:hypothetical protein